jgi:hypothetical protein
VRFDGVTLDQAVGFGANLGFSAKLLSVSNWIDAGASWGNAWENGTEKTWTFEFEIEQPVIAVNPGDNIVAKCQTFWRTQTTTLKQLIRDRVRVGWPHLLARLPEEARCVCTSPRQIRAYNHCRAEKTNPYAAPEINIAHGALMSWSGSWTGVDALQSCGSDAWKQSAVVGMREDCMQTWRYAGDNWNNWCRFNWPQDPAIYFRFTYLYSLRGGCRTTITPDTLTCVIDG